MARKVKPSKALGDVTAYRRRTGLNQITFWPQFGVTQSGGSRYENIRRMPKPVALLIVLLEKGMVSDEQLASALEIVEASRS